MRVVRRHSIENDRIRFSFIRYFPAATSPSPREAGPEDAEYDILMLDGPLFDGREDGRWGNTIWKAKVTDGIWTVDT